MFNSAGGKVALLKLALDWAIVGDDEPIALVDRPAIKAILAESDPRKALMLWVQTVSDVAARTTPLGEVLIAAADIDPAAAQLLAEASRNRMLGATMFIRYLASLDGLAAGITEQRAAELCWALTDGHLWLLIAQRSWSTADFNRWLSDRPRGDTAAHLNGPQPSDTASLIRGRPRLPSQAPAPDREPGLADLLARIKDASGTSNRTPRTPGRSRRLLSAATRARA